LDDRGFPPVAAIACSFVFISLFSFSFSSVITLNWWFRFFISVCKISLHYYVANYLTGFDDDYAHVIVILILFLVSFNFFS
jgi:hypothetical protein